MIYLYTHLNSCHHHKIYLSNNANLYKNGIGNLFKVQIKKEN